MQLIDEDNELSFLARDLLEHRLQTFLELTPVLGTGQHLTDVEHENPFAAQRLGYVAINDALGESLDDRGLANTGVTDEHRVVLRASR